SAVSLFSCSPFLFYSYAHPRALPSFPTRRSSDLEELFRHLVLRRKINQRRGAVVGFTHDHAAGYMVGENRQTLAFQFLDQLARRSEEHTSELQSRENLVCRLLLEKKKQK